LSAVYFAYPDMATVFERLGKTDVNTRWCAAFEGIITRITYDAGNFIRADEVYHQD
jgi:hypothetical protein